MTTGSLKSLLAAVGYMSDRGAYLVTGIFFVLLSLATAMGSVSLGTVNKVVGGSTVSGSYLVYNAFLEGLALVLAVVGSYFVYRSGKSALQRA